MLTDRQNAEEREMFNKAFTRWLLVPDSSCWERDVLRACKEQLWTRWQEQVAHGDDKHYLGENGAEG